MHTPLMISMPGGGEWLIMSFGLPLYFLPSIIAYARKSPNALAIFILNFFLGWTLLGWIGTMIWAFSSRKEETSTAQTYSQEYKGEKPNFQQQTQPTHQEKIDQLRQYKQLLDEKVITDEEFEKQKAAILGQ